MENEIWKKINYGNGSYQISNLGRIRNTLAKTRWAKNNILCPQRNQGYLRIRLWCGKKYKCFSVHRLVALAFCKNKNPYKFTCVHHKNHIKHDNKATNLEWVSRTRNSQERDIFVDQIARRAISTTIKSLTDAGLLRLPKTALMNLVDKLNKEHIFQYL